MANNLIALIRKIAKDISNIKKEKQKIKNDLAETSNKFNNVFIDIDGLRTSTKINSPVVFVKGFDFTQKENSGSVFILDKDDTSSEDDGINIIVNQDGVRWKRILSGSLSEEMLQTLAQRFKGNPGEDGAPGKSAYEIAKEIQRFEGTELQWLETLKGEPGDKGDNGKSAYELAVEHQNFQGDENEWLQSLKGQDGVPGTDGQDGKNAYQLAIDSGHFQGDLTEWINSLKGDQGEPGVQGPPGVKGDDGISPSFNVGTVTTGEQANVTNSGDQQNVVLDFVLPQPQNQVPENSTTVRDTGWRDVTSLTKLPDGVKLQHASGKVLLRRVDNQVYVYFHYYGWDTRATEFYFFAPELCKYIRPPFIFITQFNKQIMRYGHIHPADNRVSILFMQDWLDENRFRFSCQTAGLVMFSSTSWYTNTPFPEEEIGEPVELV